MKMHRVLPSLLLISVTMAALPAPPSVFADGETTQPAEAAPTQPAPAVPAIPAPPSNPVRIGLGRSQTSAEFSAPGGMYVIDHEGIHWQTPPGQGIQVTLDQGQILVSGLARRFTRVRLVPVQPAEPAATPPGAPLNPISYARRAYRGEFEVLVSPKDGKLSAVNVANIDEYLLGVVPQEVSWDWPIEAIKAQAVAARSYAMSHMGKWAAEGFDLLANTSDQAYGGVNVEKPSSSQAVWATRGLVVTYNGQIAATFYHSSSGGHTENNEVIYSGGPVDYLRGVPDYDNVPGNKLYAWRYSFSLDEFSQKVRAGGYDVGNLVGVASAGTIGRSGRPSQWQITGAAATRLLKAEQIRWALNLPSSPKQVAVEPAGQRNPTRLIQAAEQVAVLGPDGKVIQRSVLGTAVVGPAGTPVVTQGPVTATGGVANMAAAVTVSGGGYGHAVGMSQWGAYGLATQGKTYDQILTHFYRGAKVETRYQ